MIKDIKKELDRIVVKDTDYAFVLEEICENNRRIVAFLGAVCTVIFAVLLTMGMFHVGVEGKDMPVFLFAFLYAVVILRLAKRTEKTSPVSIMIAVYLTMIAVAFYGLLVSYRAPDQYTVTFIAMMGIMSMTFVDKPIRLGIANALGTAVCVGMVWIHKEESVRIADMINIVSFSLLSFVGRFYTVNMKVRSYVLDKLHEQDIERGQQRLNEKEMEALQLLTAIKATYDMVVSVNLTKNTYKLISLESFVTQGDAIEGNFDDIIDIHTEKVVEEHRQKYYNTFSRQGLLAAYAAGKKAVYLEYQQCDDEGVPHWLGTHTMFLEDPHSTDVIEVTISQNIDERVRKEAETKAILQEERDKAEQAQKAKTDFLFQMSHDIRTPMNAIIGFANFIKSSNDLYTIHNEYVLKLETASKQLLMLINDALEMSRIESGKLVFRRDLHDIRKIIMNVVSVIRIQADEKGLELATDISVKNPIVNCDQNHLSRVIMNLVSNAVKFTPQGGKVSVSLHEKPESPAGCTAFEVKVADTGIGMSPEFLERVFEPFEREQTSTVSGLQGTGLGLSIVKRIIETAGDTIKVESKQGEGTVFTMNISLRHGDSELWEKRRNEDSAEPLLEHMAEYFRGKRVLLVEDNDFNLTIAQTLLEAAGFVVETATDGRMAVDKVIHAPASDYYNVILMDIQMPIMDGYEATKAIRALADERAQTKIIAVTANAFDTDRDNAIAAGMNEHIAKPIDVAVLYRTLWSIL